MFFIILLFFLFINFKVYKKTLKITFSYVQLIGHLAKFIGHFWTWPNLLDILDICPIGCPIECPIVQLNKQSNTDGQVFCLIIEEEFFFN